MSVRLMSRAFYAPLKVSLRFTLLALCDEANDRGRGVFIGQERLGAKIGLGERQVRSNLKQLRDLGYIVRLEDPHPVYGTDQYEVVVAKLPQEPPEDRQDHPAADIAAPEVGRRTHRKPTAAPTGSPLPPTHEIPVRLPVRLDLSLAGAFEAFWDTYPRKVGKRAARAALERALKRAPADAILEGAARYRDDPHREDRFTAHPTTWLNRDGWDDEPLPPPRRVRDDPGARRLREALDQRGEVSDGPGQRNGADRDDRVGLRPGARALEG